MAFISEEQRKMAEVYRGDELFRKKSVEFLQEFGLPCGLLPLDGVIECGIVRETGFIWITLQKKVEHYFRLAKRNVSFGTEITGYVVKNRLQNVRGVKAKEMMLWMDVNGMEIDVHDARKIHFKALAGITRTFPVDYFNSPGL